MYVDVDGYEKVRGEKGRGGVKIVGNNRWI